MTEGKQKQRAWLYCRSATGGIMALESQLRRISAYAEQEGYSVVGASQDIESGLALDRKGINETVKAAAENKIDVLLTPDHTRIGRSYVMVAEFGDMLNRLGVKIVTLTDEADTSRQQEETLANLVQKFHAKGKKARSTARTCSKSKKRR